MNKLFLTKSKTGTVSDPNSGSNNRISRGRHKSLIQKSEVAILPPKKVIKALYDYKPEPHKPDELGFHKGEFFHVISRENDDQWYEACNPLYPDKVRGLVPVSFFEVIGKTQRQSTESAASGASNQLPDSGYSTTGSHGRSDSSITAKTLGSSRMSTGGSKSSKVYGVVQYDFNAERPDELEAKQGEAIIVIAQSNPEWFVAKPIGRLGGPGLIPVSFIEIRDTHTGLAVPDAQKAMHLAAVPKVEEWKKLAENYKKGSISLGRIDSATAGSLQAGFDGMSLSNGQGFATTNGNAYGQAYNQQAGSRMSRTRDSQSTLLAPISASIPRYCFENDKYWYIIECVLEDGSHWELSRYYQNFYDFQIALLQEFPKEAAPDGGTRILPFMPGPVTYVTDAISNGRRESLNEYVKKLLALPPYISKCHLVRQLFAPREGDFELDPRAIAEDYDLSGLSQRSSLANSIIRTASRQSSSGQMNGGSNGFGSQPPQQRSNQQRNQPSNTVPNGSTQLIYRNDPQQGVQREASSLTQASGTSNPSSGAPGNSSTTNVAASGALKIKVCFEDDLIAIRVPVDITYDQLKDKLSERFNVRDEIMVQYKDELRNDLAPLRTDHDLDVALQRNPKLMLYVGYAE
ncbi:bud emergence protein 1 [Lambiella insularis]|nr:bud emergence protein 1 [Lambiella insularis]